MSCYHPLIGIPTGELTENGKQKLLLRSLNVSADPIKELEKNNGILIPCGKCIGCRLDYSRKWADRMMLELESEKKGIFVTLTYNNENCPWSQFDEEYNPIFATLSKRHVQLFMKKLRKELTKEDIKIRFFASGEYGPKTLRPHYHLIIFGIGLSDIGDLQPHGWNDLKQPYFISEWLEKIWSRGHVLISDVSFETCAYVARYVTKKMTGDMAINYAIRNCIPEFSLMSRKPGIGMRYLQEHPECLDFENINISTREGGRKISIPKYYLDQMTKEIIDKKENPLFNPGKYDKMLEQRRKFASDKMMIELSKTDLGFAEYLAVKEENKKNLIKVLKREKGDVY